MKLTVNKHTDAAVSVWLFVGYCLILSFFVSKFQLYTKPEIPMPYICLKRK